MLVYYSLSFFFLSLPLSFSSFSLSFFKLTYSGCKFIIPFNSYPYKHNSPEQRVFFLKLSFFFLFVLPRLSSYSPIHVIFWGGTFPSRYWRLFFPKSFCSCPCQCANLRQHPKLKTPEKSSTPMNFTTFGIGVIYLVTSLELGECWLQSPTKTIVLLNFYEAFSSSRISNRNRRVFL